MGEPCKVFVGNLSFDCTSDDLYSGFGEYGTVQDAVIITDRETGRPRGFGFVTFSNETEAESAMKSMHQQNFLGRDITVKKAESRRDGGGGGGGYGGRRGGGGYGGGGYRSGGGRDRGGYDDYRGGGGNL